MSEETMNKESVKELNEYDVTPDGFVTEKEMQEGGYTKAEIYPLRYIRAKILYGMGLPVYMLYRDNTERRIKDRQELNSHDWLYGIPKLAWQEFLNTEGALGFIRAVNHVADAANDVDGMYQSTTGVVIGDQFNHICFGIGIECEGYLDDKFEEKWQGVPEEEIQEESWEEYYKGMRPYIVGLVTEFSCMMWAWFEETDLEKVPRSEIFLKICERIAYDTDNYIFGSRK